MIEPSLPDELWKEIVAFLSAGKTGKIEIVVRFGRIVGGNVSFSLPISEPDEAPKIVELTEAARRGLALSKSESSR